MNGVKIIQSVMWKILCRMDHLVILLKIDLKISGYWMMIMEIGSIQILLHHLWQIIIFLLLVLAVLIMLVMQEIEVIIGLLHLLSMVIIQHFHYI